MTRSNTTKFPVWKLRSFKKASRKVHPNDEIFKLAKRRHPGAGDAFRYYFYKGGIFAETLSDYLLKIGENPKTMSILDFAGGYGRISRHLKYEFETVFHSDLDPDMIDFCSSELDIISFLSSFDFAKIEFPVPDFDTILSFSLFTHLNPNIWDEFFWNLAGRVAPNGYMVITTRSTNIATGELVDTGKDLISFVEKNETSGRLDASVYGSTQVNPEYIHRMLRKGELELKLVKWFKPGEFDKHQDVFMFKRAI